MTATWYNAERVSQPGSVILNRWMADRQAAKTPQNAGVSYDSSLGTKGSELSCLIRSSIPGDDANRKLTVRIMKDSAGQAASLCAGSAKNCNDFLL